MWHVTLFMLKVKPISQTILTEIHLQDGLVWLDVIYHPFHQFYGICTGMPSPLVGSSGAGALVKRAA